MMRSRSMMSFWMHSVPKTAEAEVRLSIQRNARRADIIEVAWDRKIHLISPMHQICNGWRPKKCTAMTEKIYQNRKSSTNIKLWFLTMNPWPDKNSISNHSISSLLRSYQIAYSVREKIPKTKNTTAQTPMLIRSCPRRELTWNKNIWLSLIAT